LLNEINSEAKLEKDPFSKIFFAAGELNLILYIVSRAFWHI